MGKGRNKMWEKLEERRGDKREGGIKGWERKKKKRYSTRG